MDNIKFGKFLSLILRHKPYVIGLKLDENGWADVSELIALINKNRDTGLTFETLCDVVDTNNKKRYAFNEDKTKIRANQGHSINVDVELKQVEPPNILYHGTSTRYKESIDNLGLMSKDRLYVHLYSHIETAKSVGKRHGKPMIYIVDCKRMTEQNYKFYLSENDVWLTEKVPAEFLKKLEQID